MAETRRVGAVTYRKHDAVTRGEHRHPQTQGYGGTHLGVGVEAQMDEAPGPPAGGTEA